MKKTTICLAAAAMVFAGCSKDAEPNEPVKQDVLRTINIGVAYEPQSDEASMTDLTRVNYTDGNGLHWEQTDAQKLGVCLLGENLNVARASSSILIDPADATASFAVEAEESAAYLWACYPVATNCTVGQGDITTYSHIASAQTQSAAGVMDGMEGKAAFFGTEAQEIVPHKTDYTAAMTAKTAFARFIIYSSQPELQGERIKSVSLTASDGSKQLNGNFVYIAVWNNPSANRSFSTESSASTSVALTQPYALEGISSRNEAKGIYMGVIPCALEGYTYKVTTEQGVYTFSSSRSKEFHAGIVHNIYLDLSKGTFEANAQELRFKYGNPTETHTFDKQGDGAFLNGAISELTLNGTDVKASMTAENMQLTAEYAEGVEPWLAEVRFENTSNFQWYVTATKNMTDQMREAKVYLVYDGVKSANFITFRQDAGPCIEVVPTLEKLYTDTIVAAGETVGLAARLSLAINGVASTDVRTDVSTYGVTLSCGAATAEVLDADGNMRIVFPRNTNTGARTYTLRASFESNTAAVDFTQAAGEGGGTTAHT